jgi:hypothetical protein
LQLTNSIVSAEQQIGTRRSIATFDHRTLAIGIAGEAAIQNGLPFVFGSFVAGRGLTQLDIDEGTAGSYQQYQNDTVPTSYQAAEFGVRLPIHNSGTAVTASVITARLAVDQSQARAKVLREEVTANGVELRDAVADATEQHLADSSKQEFISLRLGLAMNL